MHFLTYYGIYLIEDKQEERKKKETLILSTGMEKSFIVKTTISNKIFDFDFMVTLRKTLQWAHKI